MKQVGGGFLLTRTRLDSQLALTGNLANLCSRTTTPTDQEVV
jgi:hypothetical protein